MDRRLFLKLSASSAVAVFTPLAACLHKAGTTGDGATGAAALVLSPDAAQVFFSPDGQRFTAQPFDAIVALTADGQAERRIGQFGIGAADLNDAQGMAFADDRLYVLDRGNSRIQMYSLDGGHLGQLGGRGRDPGQLAMPSALLLTQDRLYIADTLNHRVQVWEKDGRVIKVLDGMNAPRALAIWPDDTVWVLDADGRIFAFDKDLAHVATHEMRNGDRALRAPSSLAIDKTGLAYVGEIGFAGLHVVDKDGNYQESRALVADGVPLLPLHLTLDPTGDLHVSALAARPA